MSESKQHEQIAKRIAKRDGAEYPPRRGPDVATPTRVTEVGVDPARVAEEIRQVRNSQKLPYVAGPAPFVKEALKMAQGTRIGVRDSRGNIIRSARRKK